MPHTPSTDEIILESSYLIQEFLDQLSENLDQCESGAATDVDKGYLESNLRTLHSDKGAAAALGFTLIVEAIHQIEDMLISCQKGNSLQTETLFKYIDFLRSIIRISLDDSFSKSEYLQQYEQLRSSFRELRSLGQRVRMLVVDKSSTTVFVMKEEFKTLDVEIVLCSSGLDAINKVLHESFSIVVAGGQVRDLDGIALLAALRLNAETTSIKTVLITSLAAKDFSVKPDVVIGRTKSDISQLRNWVEASFFKDSEKKAG
ncbi:MAG: Hpt domain-containing protein [Pseudobacteriovorax sp.]|nr:Hpt domain-containing protein [Pseudobacteriovorax sp.]